MCEIIALNKLLEKVVGTLKRLTAHASLDTPFSEEIPTPKQLFASKNLLIQQKEIVLSIEHIIPGSLYACSHDAKSYFGVANYISLENYNVNIKFLHPNGPVGQFFRPSLMNYCWIPIHDIITKVDPPTSEALVNFTALSV